MKKTFHDQMGRAIKINHPPQKIISLVPSQTELLFHLGLKEEVIGITKFCVHPSAQFKSKPRVGGTKKYNFEKIKNLQPDLIIGNKEENEQVQIETLAAAYPVWMSDILTFEDALEMIERVGVLVGKKVESEILIEKILLAFDRLTTNVSDQKHRPTAAYLIWKNPTMVAARQTFIDEMLQLAGFQNIFGTQNRYPQITDEVLAEAAPEVIFLSSEPFPFKEKHIKEIQAICPNSIVQLVDGEMFSWYGNRLLLAADYFEKLNRDIELLRMKK